MELFNWKFELMNDPALEELLEEVIAYTEVMRHGEWLTILGGSGCGKTHLAKRLVKYWNDRHVRFNDGKQVKYGKFQSWSALYSRTFDDNGALRSMKNIGLLVIDDIGAEHQSDYDKSKLFELFVHREGMPTVITSNLTMDELKAYDPRLFSRMNRYGVIYETTSPDYYCREGVQRPVKQEVIEEVDRMDGTVRPQDIKDQGIRDVFERFVERQNEINQ